MQGSENTDAANLSGMPSTHEVEDFTKRVDEVSILIDGLQKGTISPGYVDTKLAQAQPQLSGSKDQSAVAEDGDDAAHRSASVQKKVAEIKANLEKKRCARQKYEEHIKHNPPTIASTDYIKWDFWCPEDDEDELLAKCTPENAQLRAMEQDINDRHARMVRDRQRAERCRKAGIDAYKSKQWSKAYLHFDEGCTAERSNAKLHSNAAMAAIKMGCYAQAIEHCEKVIRLHDFLLDKPEHPMVVKAWQRMAAARVGLKHFKEAAEAMEAAVLLAPDDFEIIQGAQRAQRAYNEQKIVKDLTVSKTHMKDLHTLESLTCALSGITIDSSIAHRHCKSVVGVAALPTVQQATDIQAAHMKRICDDIITFLHGHDEWRVYFRSCGGLQSAACLLSQCLCLWQMNVSDDTGAGASEAFPGCHTMITACTQLLNEACQVDSNGHMLSGCVIGDAPEQQPRISEALSCDQFLSQCCVAVGSFEAITVLLHTLTTDMLSRNKVVEAFLVEDLTSGQDAVRNIFVRLLSLQPVHRAVTVSLLSNCLPIEAFATRASAVLAVGGHADDIIPKLLRQQSNATECELVANLLANSATSPKLRGALACDSVMQLLVGHCSRLAVSGSSAAEVQALKAFLQCLYNIGLAREATAVSNCLNADSWMGTFLQILNHEDSVVAQLAACVEARHVAVSHADTAKIEERLAQRLISVAFEAGLATAVMSNMSRCDGSRAWHKPVALKLIDAVIRILAGLGAAGHLRVLKTSTAVELLAWACCTSTITDDCAGNAALCMGFIADDKDIIPVLKDLGVVTALIDMAYKRQQTPASRNAAIAAAKLAQDPICLQQMRDCHGFEKIYNYVQV